MNVLCPYCRKPAEFLSGRVVAPRFPKLANQMLWACMPCGANVKAHKDGHPMGVLATGEVRWARKQCHAATEHLWVDPRLGGYRWAHEAAKNDLQRLMRRRVYTWIADVCQMDEMQAHFAMMTHVPLLEAIAAMAREMDALTLRERYPATPTRKIMWRAA